MTNLFNPRSHFGKKINPSRREFLKQSAAVAITIAGTSCLPISEQTLTDESDHTFSQNSLDQSKIVINPIKFNGERQDPITGHYHLGNAARMYNTSLMRFHAMDSMSPFGKGGINSYAYCLGDPINQRDPSGHFAITSLLIGMIVGAVIGASLSAAAEGISVAVTGQQFDWKQVAIGAVLGAIGGGFGAASQGAAFGAKLGLAFGDAALSGMADFMMNSAAGMPAGEAAKNAGIGAVIGLVSFGVSSGLSNKRKIVSLGHQNLNEALLRRGRPLGNNFIIFGNRNGSLNDILTVTSHGTLLPGTYTSEFRYSYYVRNGMTLIDPGLRDVAEGAYQPMETVLNGRKMHNYFLENFDQDTSVAASVATQTGSDVVMLKYGHTSTSKNLQKSLIRDGLNHYKEIRLSHCRSTLFFAKDESAISWL